MQNATNPLAHRGDTISDTTTGTLIKVTNMGGHFNLYIQAGADRIAELGGNFPTAQAACRRASYIRTALLGGTTIAQLVDATTTNQTAVLAEARTVLIEAMDTAGRTEDEVAADINADADLWAEAVTAEHNRVVDLVADALATDGESYAQWRARVRKQVVAQANQNLGQFVQARTTRPANLTPAQTSIVNLAANNGGRIVRGGHEGQATSPQITALHACGLATITYGTVGRTRTITGAQLTAKGFKLAGVDMERAA